MNATTTAPVANETVADIKKMDDTELRALLNKLRDDEFDLADKELAANQKQQAAVVAQIRDLKATRTNELTKIAEAIKSQGFSVKEIFGSNALSLFSSEELTAEAQSRGLFTAKAAKTEGKAEGEKKTRGPIVPKVFASDNNPVFIDIPKATDDHQRVVDVVIKQGRINEPYNGKSGPAFASIGKPALRVKGTDIAETEKNLAKFVVQESKEFAKSPVGKAELTKIATAIFNYVDPKAKDAEPHNEAQAAMQGKA